MQSNLSRRPPPGQLSLKWANDTSRTRPPSALAAGGVEPSRSGSIEARLRQLEARYRSALSRTVALKAKYLALAADPSATAAAVEHAERRWQMLKLRRKALAARMAALEDIERVDID
jgi:hypothetical protein